MPKRPAQFRAPWTATDLKKLAALRRRGASGAEIAAALKRTPTAVYQRLVTEGLTTPRRRGAGAKKKKRTGGR
jgi:hypothetical protein